MAGIRPSDNAGPPHCRNRLKTKCTLFVLRSQYVLSGISKLPELKVKICFPIVTPCFPTACFSEGTGISSFSRTRDRPIVKKILEYQQRAPECGDMALTVLPAPRQQLEQMAETWDQLA